MTERPGPEMLEAALRYVGLGWAVFPCKPCGKAPATENGYQDATKSPFHIRADFWKRWPHANPALATGERSGLWVLDIDVKHGDDGRATLTMLERMFGEPLPPTLTQDTPTGGEQRFFLWDESREVRNRDSRKLGPGIDARGNGGYVMLPPSIYPDGFETPNGPRYRWREDPGPTVELAKAPEWLVRWVIGDPEDNEWLRRKLGDWPQPEWMAKRLKPKGEPARPLDDRDVDSSGATAYGRKALDDEVLKVLAAVPGSRNATLNESAFAIGRLVGGGELPYSLAFQRLDAARRSWDGVDRAKQDRDFKTLKAALEQGMRQPRQAPPREPPAGEGEGKKKRKAARPTGWDAPPPPPADIAARTALGRMVWRQANAQGIFGSPAAEWLIAQGIDPRNVGPWVGFVPDLDYLHADPGGETVCIGRWPALVAAMAKWPDREEGKPEVVAVIAAYLTEGGGLADCVDRRTGEVLTAVRHIGAWEGAAVRLKRPPGDTMIVTADLVSGLKVRVSPSYGGYGVWVAGSLDAMAHMVLPDTVRDVVVAGAGDADATTAARIARGLGHGRTVAGGCRTVRIARPSYRQAPAAKVA